MVSLLLEDISVNNPYTSCFSNPRAVRAISRSLRVPARAQALILWSRLGAVTGVLCVSGKMDSEAV
jgi:hypothetical protein